MAIPEVGGFQTDVTGTEIASYKPIGVIAGNACADVPLGVGTCDILSEMLLPTALYSTDFFTVPLPNAAADVIRIMAAADNTLVSVDDGVAPTNFVLNRGEFREFTTNLATHITSDGPILVVQYAVGFFVAGAGDPFEMQIMPTDAGLPSHRLFTPHMTLSSTFATIVAPSAAVPTVTLNGQAVTGFAPLPGGTHQSVVAPVPAGQSVVTAAEPVLVYGMGFRGGETYGYPAGF